MGLCQLLQIIETGRRFKTWNVRSQKCDRLNRAIALFYVDAARTRIKSFGSGIDDTGWSYYDRNSANKHWSHESRLGPRHRIGPLQHSQQFAITPKRGLNLLLSQFGQKYDNNSARNNYKRTNGRDAGKLKSSLRSKISQCWGYSEQCCLASLVTCDEDEQRSSETESLLINYQQSSSRCL